MTLAELQKKYATPTTESKSNKSYTIQDLANKYSYATKASEYSSFAPELNSFLSDIGTQTQGFGDGFVDKSVFEPYYNSAKNYKTSVGDYINYFESNRDKYDAAQIGSIIDSLKQTDTALGGYLDLADYWNYWDNEAQWDTFQNYDSVQRRYNSQTAEQSRLQAEYDAIANEVAPDGLNRNSKGQAYVKWQEWEKNKQERLALKQAEIDALDMSAYTPYLEQYNTGKRIEAAQSKVDRYDIEKALTRLDMLYNSDYSNADLQNAEKYEAVWLVNHFANEIPKADDFETYSNMIVTPEYVTNNTTGILASLSLDEDYEYINKVGNSQGGGLTKEEKAVLDSIPKDQIAIYNYIYAKYGAKMGQTYLNQIKDGMSYYINAQNKAKEYVDNYTYQYGTNIGKNANFVQKLGIAAEQGWDSFFENTVTAMTGDIEKNSANDYAFASARENSNWLGKLALDMAQTGANMAPSVLLSAMTSNLLGGGAIAGEVAKIIGSGAMGVSAAGGAYKEAINKGLNEEQAKTYSVLVGAAESGLNYLLGGIGKMGGKLTGEAFGKAIAGIDKTLLRIAAQTGVNALGEGVEEGLQEILAPIFEHYVTGGNYDSAKTEDVLYSALLGALMGATGGISDVDANLREQVISERNNTELDRERIAAMAKQFLSYPEETAAHVVGVNLQQLLDTNKTIMSSDVQKIFSDSKNAGMFRDYMAGTYEDMYGKPMPRSQTTAQPTVSDLARTETATNEAEADNLADEYKTAVNRVILEQSAKYGEAGADMLNAIWEIQGDRLDAAEYINAMDEAYYAGKNGKEYSFEGHSVEPDVARVMYEAGKQDAKVLNNGQQEVYNEVNNTETEGNINGTEGRNVYLRNGGEWNRGQDTGKQLRQLGGRTGENQAGQVTARPKDAGAASLNLKKEKVNSLSLGIKGGTNAKNISLIESGETEAMTKAREAAAERGLKTVFFAGDNLKLYDQKSKKYVYARGAIQGDTIYVRVDHSEFTAEQIAKHEAGHDMINKGEVSVEDVRNRLIADGYDIDNVVDLYEAAYRGAKLNYNELLEEIICDSIADMNIFEGKVEVGTEYIGKVSSAVEQTKTETDSARAPPTDSDVKLSRTPLNNRARKGRSIEIETMENNRFERLREFYNDIPDEWFAFSKEYFYIYSNQSFTEYTILVKVKITNNNKLAIKKFAEEIKNAVNGGSGAFNSWINNFRRGRGRNSWNSISSAGNESIKRINGVDGRNIQREIGERMGEHNSQSVERSSEDSKSITSPQKIDYSLEFSEDSPLLQLEEAKTALKENDAEIKKLRKQLENAKGQTKLTPRPSIRQADINRLAKKVIADHSSTLNATDIAAQIKTLAEMAIRKGVDDVDVSTLARSIASDIVNSATELVDDGLREDYKGIKEYLKKTPLQFSDKSDIADYNLFRKRNFGRLNIRNKGLGVDRAYQELQEMFGKGLFPDGIDHPADQLQHFADLLDRLQDTYENPYDYNLAVATEEVATDILASIQEEQLREVPKTFADKAREKLNAVKEKAAQQRKAAVNKVRADRNKKIAELKADFRESKDKTRESRKSRELRERITRHVAALSVKLRNPTDAKHIPESFRATVAKLLSAINLESQYTYDEQGKRRKDNSGTATKRTQAFKQLKQEYLKILGNATIDPDLLGDEGNLQAVIDMEDKPISAMNSEELLLVWKVLAATESALSNYNKLFAQGKFGTVAGIAEALKRDNRGKKTVVESKLRDSVVLSNETPETFFNGLGNAGREIFRMLRNAQDKATLLTAKVKAFTAELEDIKNAKKWEKEIHTVTLGGQQIKISAAQIMELFVLCHRQQALDHIFEGGIRPDTIQSGVRKIAYSDAIRGVTLDEITDAFNSLSAEQKNVALKLQEFASKNLSDMGNEASMQVYGYKKFNEENYWPIRVNKQEVKTTSESETAVPSIANKGFTKGTKPNSSNSVRLGSIFDTFAQHSAEMVAYSAYLGVIEDVNRVKNFQFFDEMGERAGTVKGIVDTVHGNGGSAWLEQLLRDIAGGNTATKTNVWADKLFSKAKATAVGANLSVIVQQPTAMIRAFSMINPKYFVKGALAKDGWKKAVKYSPIAQWKSWGYFDISSGKTNKTLLFDTSSLTDKVVETSMIPASFMDAMAWGTLWNAVEAEVKATNKNLEVGSKEYYEAVNKRFTEIIDATQVVDGILQRSANMRSTDGFMKMASSFMGEPTKQLNMVIQALQDFNGADEQQKVKAASKLARTSIVLLVSGLINSAVKALVGAIRNDDKEKEYWEKWLEAFAGDGTLEGFWKSNIGDTINPLGYMVGLNEINSIIQGYDAKRMDMEIFAELNDSVKNFIKTLNGEGKHNVTGASVELLSSISKLVGIPVGNIKRDIHSVISTIAIESNSYVMQYRMEKTLKNIQYSGNKKNFMDILYNAYKDDPDAYEIIYNDLVKSGYDINGIMDAMNDRLKKDQGVTKITELDQRWMPPAIEKEYNEKLKTLSSSSVWKKADEDDRAKVENIMYNYLSGTDSGKATAEKIEGGKQYGLTDTEYILYKLALEMVDKPNAEGKTGTYTSAEKKEALNMVGLTYSEKNYLLGKYDK